MIDNSVDAPQKPNDERSPSSRDWGRSPWPIFALIAIGLLCYATSVFSPFHGAELPLFVDSPALHSPLTCTQALDAMPHAPLTLFGFALNGWASPGDPLPLRAANVLLHLVNALLIYVILLQWLGPKQWGLAQAAALVFLICIPGMVSVHYLPGRPGMQAACLALFALHLFSSAFEKAGTALSISLRAPDGDSPDVSPDYPKLAGAVACYALAAGSHAAALGLPLVWLAVDVARGGWQRVLQHRGIHAAGIGAMLLLGRIWTSAAAMEQTWSGTPSPASWNAVTAYAGESLRALMAGSHIRLMSAAAESNAFSFWGGAILLAAAMFLGLACFRRGRSAAGWMWLLAAWAAPAIGLMSRENLLAAYSMYFSMIGLFLAVPIALASVKIRPIMGVLEMLVVLSFFLQSTRLPWNDPVALWKAEAQRHPDQARECLRHAARFAQALAERAEDAQLRPELLSQAESIWRNVYEAAPPEGDADAALQLGKVLRELGRAEDARQLFEATLRLDPFSPEASLHAGLLAFEAMQANPKGEALPRTLNHFQRLERLGTLPPEARTPYLMALAASGQFRHAAELLQSLPGLPADLPSELKTNLEQMAARDEAMRKQEEALLADPSQRSKAWMLRAQRYLLEGRLVSAAYLLEVLAVDEPQAATTLDQIKTQLAQRGK